MTEKEKPWKFNNACVKPRKLTDEQAQYVRDNPKMSAKELAKLFNVGVWVIRHLRNGKTYKEVVSTEARERYAKERQETFDVLQKYCRKNARPDQSGT